MCKISFASLFAATALALLALPAAANGVYVTAHGGFGATQYNQSDGDGDSNNISGTYGGGVGYRWDTDGTFRYRAELEYSRVGATELLANSGIDIRQNVFLANAIAEFNTKVWVKPYVGFGVGIASIRALAASFADGRTLVDLEDSTTSAFAYQILGGLTVAPSKRFEVFTDIRYVKPSGVTFELFDNRSRLINEVTDFGSIQGRFGVRVNF